MALVLEIIGGCLIAYPVGEVIDRGNAQWNLAVIGGAVIGLSIPFSLKHKKHAKRGVRIYNFNIKKQLAKS